MNWCVNRDCNRYAIGKDGFCYDCSQPSVRYTCVIVNKDESIDPKVVADLSRKIDKLFGFKRFIKDLFCGRT